MKIALIALALTAILMAALTQAASAGVVQTSLTLNFTIGSGDTVYVGESRNPASGTWYSNNLTKRFLCAQNSTIASKDVAVVVAADGGFRRLNYTSGSKHSVEILQDYGQPFYIFFTDANCTPAINNYPAVEDGRIGVMGTTPEINQGGALAWIIYPSLNITDQLRLPRGVWEILVENNGTKKNVTQIRVTTA